MPVFVTRLASVEDIEFAVTIQYSLEEQEKPKKNRIHVI